MSGALPLSTLALLALVAFVAGTIDAIAGGGGLLTFPALIAVGLPPHLALGTNKGQSVFGSSVALASFVRDKKVSVERAKTAFPAAFVGALMGARLVLYVPPTVLRPVILVLLVGVALFLALRPMDTAAKSRVPARWHTLVGALLGLVIGGYDGFFGPGTGTFMIIAAVALLGDTLTEATANAKVVNFASNLASVVIFASRGVVLWKIALPMAIGQFLGGALGARLAVRGGAKVIRYVVLAVVAALVSKLGYDLLYR
ncbi:MAG: TSUP family transporter [Deltaproteobacteria bacterium]|nr:TSUP family transporter [Deltaproteobacteria bacterium]